MKNLFALLKYLDRSKITPEAVNEILKSLGISVSVEQAAELSNAFKTRGAAGLLPYIPDLAALRASSVQDQAVHICPKCKHMFTEE